MTWVNRESPREPYPINYCLTFFICSMKMSCLVSLTCSFAPFDTSLTRPTHFIIISSPIVNKLRGLKDHAVKQQKDPTGSHGSKEQTHMRPFLLNVFFYRKFIHAKVMHRPTGKVISVATTNARNIRTNIP
ncbi:BnaCnng46380D [Brassica napus]|uniref:BnaCnng46380D protein n=1 Tax=Brassica napus TaxID=3708 RepID=A0A078JCE7_BRANA|nr:BnaCnng46380D [Brassica napus]